MKKIFLKPHRLDTVVFRNSRFNKQNKHHKNQRVKKHDLKVKCKRLKEEMEDISKEQKSIKEGQAQVGEKLKAIEMECTVLQEETKVMVLRSVATQFRLALMLNIYKAREEGDLAKAAQITQLLREMIARDNTQQ
ncbi:hypothetical protein PTKIN_Ptkin14bG0092100 [Pterospermum kingtungense]